jgi:3'-phosphoadenosine 5'-phosphosulfate sulfotransferase (PAPS reductase)/FAD synthetase
VSRALIWFSAGAASAVAARIALNEHDGPTLIARIDPGSEHPDTERFAADVERWLGRAIEVHRSATYVDTWDVWERTKYLVGPTGARCTAELKKKVRYAIERPDDIQVFGYTAEEERRADRFREQNPGVRLWTPLIEHGLTKSDCLAIIDRAGIELHAMYRLGYSNANCVGCPKGGIGYWNKIRRDFPETFDRMAGLERQLGVSVLRADGERLWLDELDPARGSHSDELEFECSLMCHGVDVA